jgi:hypothetical protein
MVTLARPGQIAQGQSLGYWRVLGEATANCRCTGTPSCRATRSSAKTSPAAAEVCAFTRPGDLRAQAFARNLGAAWAGGSDETPPGELDAALIFAPAGPLVPAALAGVRKGGVVVCGGIHMSDIPAFPYALLWGERKLRSVARRCWCPELQDRPGRRAGGFAGTLQPGRSLRCVSTMTR